MKPFHIGQLAIGTAPRIVGTVSTGEALPSAPRRARQSCDIVEVRLDAIGPDACDWMHACQAIEAAGFPVLLTLRLSREGGQWKAPDIQREPILAAAIESLAAIDIELESELFTALCQQARNRSKTIVVSYHNFDHTPDFQSLKRILDRILAVPCAIPKIATMVATDADIATLMKLIDPANPRPVCIIGMGSKGAETRILFPSRGSCLAYGYLDAPCAPGQLAARRLRHAIQPVDDHPQTGD